MLKTAQWLAAVSALSFLLFLATISYLSSTPLVMPQAQGGYHGLEAIGGTLVVMVPSNAGLIVAADSRTTVLGINCDGQFKIEEPTHPSRTIVTVTGVGIILDAPSQPVPLGQICEHVRVGRRLLDIEKVVLAYLEQSTLESIVDLDINSLAESCLHAVDDARTKNSMMLLPYRGKEMFSVVLSTYDPARQIAAVRGFVVGITELLEPVLIRNFATHIQAENNQDYWAFGETDYLNHQVLGGIGRRFLSAATTRFYTTTRAVRDVTREEAEALAIDLIQATQLTTELVPAPSGIGGAIDVVLLGASARPVRLRWKSQ